MGKVIDTTIVLTDFEGTPIPDVEYDLDGKPVSKKDLTLKSALLHYLNMANMMGITSDSDRMSAYLAGIAIAQGGQHTWLDQPQYDIVKRLVDSNKMKSQGQESEVYKLVIQMKIKKIIDEAVTEKEGKSEAK